MKRLSPWGNPRLPSPSRAGLLEEPEGHDRTFDEPGSQAGVPPRTSGSPPISEASCEDAPAPNYETIEREVWWVLLQRGTPRGISTRNLRLDVDGCRTLRDSARAQSRNKLQHQSTSSLARSCPPTGDNPRLVVLRISMTHDSGSSPCVPRPRRISHKGTPRPIHRVFLP